MSGASFKMDLTALDSIVGSIIKKVQSRQELLETIGETLVSSTLDRFEKSEAPDGTKWKASKKAMPELGGKCGKILIDSGQLRASIVYEASPDMVVVGSNKIYSAIHQHGGKAGRGLKVNIPARPYLGISKEDKEEIKFIVKEFFSM